MKIKTWIKYEESYLPKGCRKLRYRECEAYVNITLAETSMNNLQLAFEDQSFNGQGKIYLYNGKLWRLAKIRDVCAGGEDEYGYHTPLEALVYWREHSSKYFMFESDRYIGRKTSKAAVIGKARSDMKKFLLVDGQLYVFTRVPFYSILTFGCGNNHGGTGLFVSYNKWTYKDFDALHGKEAVQKATEIALRRGDTESVQNFHEMIVVHIPELVKQGECYGSEKAVSNKTQ